MTFGSADSDSFGYDGNTGRMTQYQYSINGSVLTGGLTWNPNGSLGKLAITDPFTAANQQTCTYVHDDLARLGSVSCTGGSTFSQTFTYDAFGNIHKSGTISFAPNYDTSTNRYSSLPHGTPTYDANGNVLTDGFHTYSWDTEGRMQHMDSSGWTFDALGRWVEKSSTQAVYTPLGNQLALMSGQTLQEARLPLAGGTMAKYAAGTTGPKSYWHPDWLGTSRLTSTQSRTVGEDAAFAPFGEQYIGGGFDSVFTGSAFQDKAGDLWDFAAREYHPTQGRWISPDPAGLAAVDITDPQTWNRYGYVRNNPLGLTDPTGLCDPNDPIPCFSVTGTASAPSSIDSFLYQIYFQWYFGALGYPSPRNGSGGGPGTPPPQKPPGKSATDIARIARCAASVGNSLSLAALLPNGAPLFLNNALSNDFSTISNLVTGPDRLGSLVSVGQGKLTSTAIATIGQIPTGPSGLLVAGEGAAQKTIEVTPRLIDTVLGRTAGAILGTAVDVKLAWDGATYLYGVAKCSNVVP